MSRALWLAAQRTFTCVIIQRLSSLRQENVRPSHPIGATALSDDFEPLPLSVLVARRGLLGVVN